MIFTDDELRIILSVMSQANYPTNMFRAVDAIMTKLQIALQPDLQPRPPADAAPALTDAPPVDGQKSNRPERRRMRQAESAPTEGQSS